MVQKCYYAKDLETKNPDTAKFIPKRMRSLCVRTLGPVSGMPFTFDLAPSDAGRIS